MIVVSGTHSSRFKWSLVISKRAETPFVTPSMISYKASKAIQLNQAHAQNMQPWSLIWVVLLLQQ